MAFIAGNWKMHMGPAEAENFFCALKIDELMDNHEIVIFPPTTSLFSASESRERDPRIQLGIQNIHWENEGAFTGEVSALMAFHAGAKYALIGHSERRHLFNETDEQVGLKVAAALSRGLTPVICVGETLEEREADRVDEVILTQLDSALASIPGPETHFLIAYEPVWAIGTGRTATPLDATTAHQTLRERLRRVLGENSAASTQIIYGGSVQSGNAAELLISHDVDGVLVGGASLDVQSFTQIVRATR